MDFKLLRKLFRKVMNRKAAEPVVDTEKTVEKPKRSFLPLDPPFIAETGRYDAQRASAWQREKLRPRWFHVSKFPERDRHGELTGRMLSRTYERPRIGDEIKGKKAIRAAKRERVRQMKAAQIQ